MHIKKVLVAGTFDIIHPGHVYYLNQAKKRGNFLIVVIARDKTVLKIKQRRPYHSETTRLKQVKKLNIADKVMLGNMGNRLKVIIQHQPDIICLGYDQKITITYLKTELKNKP